MPVERIARRYAAMLLSALLSAAAASPPATAAAPADRGGEAGVTFLATSDSHYDAFENEDRNDRNHATIEQMNAIAGTPWPRELGGDAIGRPRGVVLLGDVIDDGDRKVDGNSQTQRQWECFLKQFGLDGSDGLLKFPVFEGWGNHDGPPAGKERFGFSMQGQLKARNKRRLQKGLIANLSENGLHYSWDWGRLHLLQVNIYPADRQHPAVRYNPVWHDPQGALRFLKSDLKRAVGTSGRPVVILAHCGFDTNWWHAEDWAAFYEAVKPYNVLAYLHGHTGTGVHEWKPKGQKRPLTVINTGQTENGFFVVQVTETRLRAAYRLKQAKRHRDRLGEWHYEWNGEWAWRHVLDKPLRPSREAMKAPPSPLTR